MLDRARQRATAALRQVHQGPTTGTDQAATERDSFARTYAGRTDQLMTVERGLCFGRIDTVRRATFYVGRLGLFVAVTRATKRLGVICDGPLPDVLRGARDGRFDELSDRVLRGVRRGSPG